MNSATEESLGYKICKSWWTKISLTKILVFAIPFILSVFLAIVLEEAWLLCGLVISLGTALVVAIQIFLLKYDYIVFYDSNVFFHKGFIRKSEKSYIYTGVREVTVEQTFIGRILNYGRINANLFAAGMIHIDGVKSPAEVAKHLNSLIVVPEGTIKHITVN